MSATLFAKAEAGSKTALRKLNLYMIATAKAGGCTRCPERHPACLDLHHRYPDTKAFSIGIRLRQKDPIPYKELLDEIAKCQILCSNCHRKHHHAERESRRKAKERLAEHRKAARDDPEPFPARVVG